MDQRPEGQASAIDHDVQPVLARPVAQWRSPIAGRRSIEPPSPDLRADRPTMAIPPARALIRPLAIAIPLALPVLALVGWQPAIIVAAAAVALRELGSRTARAPFSFGDGFLPFRARDGWPQGVQEEDGVRWNWSPVGDIRPRHQTRG